MKKLFFVIVALILMTTCVAYADDNPCKSSGLQSADASIMTVSGSYNRCLCGVELVPASADATLILYDHASAASGNELAKILAYTSDIPGGWPPGRGCIEVNNGIYADVTGTGAAYIVWYK